MVKWVDCVIIAMLEEERDLFLSYCEHLITRDKVVCENTSFTEFIFFDRDGNQRNGVICSSTVGMGNTAACALYYALSRKYRANLYINVGVAGYVKDVRIGDVVVVDRITTMGENNATNTPWQLQDAPQQEVSSIVDALKKTYGSQFKICSQKRLSAFRNELQNHGCDEEKIKSILGARNSRHNTIRSGSCLTVPEVIKTGIPGNDSADQTQQVISRFPPLRKYVLLDMEAYYFSVWHSLIKKWEPDHSATSSMFLSFKSVSDMADNDKALVEECGSRALAMNNLCDVVCAYLTDIHSFLQPTDSTLYTYFQSEICTSSLDPLTLRPTSDDASMRFGEMCNYFILDSTDSALSNQADSVAAACELLSTPSNSLWLYGRAGTGKSTFVSYVYHAILARGKRAVLIDFSKFSDLTYPTDSQVIYLLKKLLSQEPNITVFLDGISSYYTNYETLLDVIQSANCTNLSLCVSDISSCSNNNEQAMKRNPQDFLPSDSKTVNCSFAGVSLFSPHFDKVLDCAQKYFCALGKKFDKESIQSFIKKSKLQYLDFRLLKMFAEYPLNNAKNLFEFVDRYCSRKKKRGAFTELYSYNPFALAENDDIGADAKDAYVTLSKNSYARAFLFANCIFQVICKKTPDLDKFLKSDYILSDDMNLFLSHLLNGSNDANAFFSNTLAILSGYSPVCCSAETQLMYSLFQLKSLNRVQEAKRKEMLYQKIEYALEQIRRYETRDEVYLDWLLQDRTFSIVLAQYCAESKYLMQYNSLLLSDSDAERNNLAFHLYYYSRQEFTFKQVHTLVLENISSEMFYNTYYTLFHSLNLDDPEQDVAGKLVVQDPFIYMNLITFAHLAKKYIIELSQFPNLSSSTCAILKKVYQAMGSLERTPANASFPLTVIQNLVQSVYQQLESTKQ